MATFKCTMLFTLATNRSNGSIGKRVAGWSESVYSQTSDFAALRTSFVNLCQKRAALLARGASIVGQRYQMIDPRGRATVNGQQFAGNYGDSDVPQMSLTFVVPSASSPNNRRFTLRGLSDIFVVEGEYKPSAFINQVIADFVAALATFRFRATNLTNEPVPISTIAGDGTFVLQQPLTFAVNDYLNVSRVRVSGGTNSDRYHVSVATDTQHGKFSDWSLGAGTGGTARLDTIIYPLFDGTAQVDPVVVTRKVGRPINGYRGRASTRA